MTRDVNRERLDRLRGELAELRARASSLGVDAAPSAAAAPAEPAVQTPAVAEDMAAALAPAAAPDADDDSPLVLGVDEATGQMILSTSGAGAVAAPIADPDATAELPVMPAASIAPAEASAEEASAAPAADPAATTDELPTPAEEPAPAVEEAAEPEDAVEVAAAVDADEPVEAEGPLEAEGPVEAETLVATEPPAVIETQVEAEAPASDDAYFATPASMTAAASAATSVGPTPSPTQPAADTPLPDEPAPAEKARPSATRRPRRRPRAPRPPRRNPLRRRARRPPSRLAVPTPIPVRRRPEWVAAPRWPKVTLVAGIVIALVLVPVVAQLAVRLLTAMEETSFLLGADPTRADWLRAAAGVAGGGITAALATFALGIVRGRPGYVAGGVAVLLLFVAFPWVAHTANAGLVSAPLPSLAAMIQPEGWGNGLLLQGSFLLALGALVGAVADLAWRSVQALRTGIASVRRRS